MGQRCWNALGKDLPALVEPPQTAEVGRRKMRLVYASRSRAGEGSPEVVAELGRIGTELVDRYGA
jgi:hypothetical protein